MLTVAIDARDAPRPSRCAAGGATPLSCSSASCRRESSMTALRERRPARARGRLGAGRRCRVRLRRGADVAARAQLLPAAAPAVPRRRDDPRPRLRGPPRGLRAAHRREVPLRSTPRAARSAERVICVSRVHAPTTSCARYGVDPARVRVIPNAPSLPIGDGAARPTAAVPAGGRRPARARRTSQRLVAAWRRCAATGCRTGS